MKKASSLRSATGCGKEMGRGSAKQQRLTSLANLHAVDNALVQAGVGGFQAFSGGTGLSEAGMLLATLVLHFDEASPNLSMAPFLQHHVRLRMLFVRGVSTGNGTTSPWRPRARSCGTLLC